MKIKINNNKKKCIKLMIYICFINSIRYAENRILENNKNKILNNKNTIFQEQDIYTKDLQEQDIDTKETKKESDFKVILFLIGGGVTFFVIYLYKKKSNNSIEGNKSGKINPSNPGKINPNNSEIIGINNPGQINPINPESNIETFKISEEEKSEILCSYQQPSEEEINSFNENFNKNLDNQIYSKPEEINTIDVLYCGMSRKIKETFKDEKIIIDNSIAKNLLLCTEFNIYYYTKEILNTIINNNKLKQILYDCLQTINSDLIMENTEYLKYINHVKDINDIKSENVDNLLLILAKGYSFITKALLEDVKLPTKNNQYSFQEDKNILCIVEYFNKLKKIFQYNYDDFKNFMVKRQDPQYIDFSLLSKEKFDSLGEKEKNKIFSECFSQYGKNTKTDFYDKLVQNNDFIEEIFSNDLFFTRNEYQVYSPNIFNMNIIDKQLRFTSILPFNQNSTTITLDKDKTIQEIIDNYNQDKNPYEEKRLNCIEFDYKIIRNTIVFLNSFLIGQNIDHKQEKTKIQQIFNDDNSTDFLSYNPFYSFFQKYLEKIDRIQN